jgi:hypothetical protein
MQVGQADGRTEREFRSAHQALGFSFFAAPSDVLRKSRCGQERNF